MCTTHHPLFCPMLQACRLPKFPLLCMLLTLPRMPFNLLLSTQAPSLLGFLGHFPYLTTPSVISTKCPSFLPSVTIYWTPTMGQVSCWELGIQSCPHRAVGGKGIDRCQVTDTGCPHTIRASQAQEGLPWVCNPSGVGCENVVGRKRETCKLYLFFFFFGLLEGMK